MDSRLQKLLAFYEKDPTDAFVQYGIALEYSSLQQNEQALLWFEKLRTEHSDYLPTYYMLGELYQRLHAPDKARRVYEEGIQLSRQVNDMHTLSELSAALDDMEE